MFKLRDLLPRHRRAAACAGAVLLASAGLYACDDLLVSPKAHPQPHVASLALRLQVAGAPGGGVRDAFDRANRLHVRVTRGAETLVDSTVAMAPVGQDTRLTLDVVPREAADSVGVALTLSLDGAELFRGTGGTRLHAGQVTPVDVTLSPVAAAISVADSLGPLASLGDTVQLTGRLLFATGDTLPSASLAWTSLDPAVATVAGARAIAAGNGQARLVASANGMSDTLLLRVRQVVRTLRTTAPLDTLLVGDTVTYTATPLDGRGNAVADAAVTWMSTNLGVLEVSPAGVVLARAAGAASVLAMAGGSTGEVRVTVLTGIAAVVGPAGGTLSFAGDSVRLVIPAGALTQARRITIIPLGTYPPSDRVVAGSVYQFGPDGTTFLVPAGLTFRYDPARVPAGYPASELRVHRAAGAGWQEVPGTVDTAAHTVAGSIGGFSSYGVLARVQAATVTVAPESAQVVAGRTLQLTATLRDASGAILTGRPIAWTSSDTGQAAVSATGLVTTRRDGLVSITATSGVASGHASLRVLPVPAASVAVSPDSASLFIGGGVALSAVVRDSAGGVLAGRQVAWSVSDSTVATVSGAGFVTGRGVGTTVVTAASGVASGTATVRVAQVPAGSVVVTPATPTLHAGGTVQLAATVLDSAGAELAGRPVQWSSSDTTVAVVSPTGLVTARADGTAVITAASGAATGLARIAVVPVPAASVAVSPDSASIFQGAGVQLTATVRDSAGGVLAGGAVAWSTSDSLVATVSASGFVTGTGAGHAVITAASGGASGTARIVVRVPPVFSRLVISPDSAVLGSAGDAVGFVAAGYDQFGNPIATPPVVWSTPDGAVVEVDSATGLTRALAAGTARVIAAAGAIADTATVRVQPQPARVEATPDSATIHDVGEPVPATAVVLDGSATPVAGAPVAWSSASPGIAIVDSAGSIRGLTDGVTRVYATSAGAAADSVLVRVQLVARVGVDSIFYVVPGDSGRITPAALDANGDTIPGRVFTFSSSDTTIVTVHPVTGVAHALRVGRAVITSAQGTAGVHGSTTIDVAAPGAIAEVRVLPDTVYVPLHGTAQLTAHMFDTDGREITGQTATWSSGDTLVARVDSNGLVTGESEGDIWVSAFSPNGVQGMSLVRVRGPVGSVQVVPDTATLSLGGSRYLTATVYDPGGNPISRTVTWTSSDTTVMTTDGYGTFYGQSAGSALAIATADGVSGSATVSVVPGPAPVGSVARIQAHPDSLLMTALAQSTTPTYTAYDSSGNVVSGAGVRWSTPDTTVVAVDPATGEIRSLAVGTAMVIVQSSTPPPVGVVMDLAATATPAVAADTIPVRVYQEPASSRVIPAAPLLFHDPGEPVPVRVETYDYNGYVIPGLTGPWVTDDPAIAVVDSAGTVRGVGDGTTQVFTTIGGLPRAAATVTVRMVASVGLNVPGGNLNVGDTLRLVATAYDAGGSPIAGRTFTFASTDPAVATVDSTGLVTATGGGSAQIAVSQGTQGIGATASLRVTATAAAVPFAMTQVEGGYYDGCALRADLSAWCWGSNSHGLLGTGGGDTSYPAPVAGGLQFSALSTGYLHTCALQHDAAGRPSDAYCWGDNSAGEAGQGAAGADVPAPALVAGGLKWTAITAGYNFTCGIDAQQAAYCWGANAGGASGLPVFSSQASPVTAVPGGHLWAQVVTGNNFACGVDTASAAWCWGTNNDGVLGDTTSGYTNVPRAVPGGHAFTRLTAGLKHVCGIDPAHKLWCWGWNGLGLLGVGDTDPRVGPVAVQTALAVSDVEANGYHTCLTTTSAEMYCWGRNGDGELGAGDTFNRYSVPAVPMATGVASMGLGWYFSCYVSTSNGGYCTGMRQFGQLGDGVIDSTGRTFVQPVLTQPAGGVTSRATPTVPGIRF